MPSLHVVRPFVCRPIMIKSLRLRGIALFYLPEAKREASLSLKSIDSERSTMRKLCVWNTSDLHARLL